MISILLTLFAIVALLFFVVVIGGATICAIIFFAGFISELIKGRDWP